MWLMLDRKAGHLPRKNYDYYCVNLSACDKLHLSIIILNIELYDVGTREKRTFSHLSL